MRLPTKLPAGKIILAFDGYEKMRSCLRLSDGEAELVLESDGVEKDHCGLLLGILREVPARDGHRG